MEGLRDPTPPISGQPGTMNRRRRNSLPALSSAQLNRLSANACNTKGQGGKGNNLSKSLPEKLIQKDTKSSTDKGKGNLRKSRKSLRPIGKIIDTKDGETSQDTNNNENISENNEKVRDSEEILPNSCGSSMLKSKVQPSKSNAVFIFRFEDDNDKAKEASTTESTSTSSNVETSPSPGSDIETGFSRTSELRRTWPRDSIDDINSYNLIDLVRFNRMGFCGFKHKQFRESGKLYLTMSPVQELKTPIDETEIESDDEWSTSSGTDIWTDSRSWNGTNSPQFSRSRTENGRHHRPIKINAKSNLMLRSEPDPNLCSNLRSALSLSPRRASSSRNSSLTSRDVSSRPSDSSTRCQSPRRIQRMIRRGSLDSTVGQIFNNLRSQSSVVYSAQTPSHENSGSNKTRHTSLPSSSASSSSHKSGEELPKSKSQLAPRLLARRRSLSALPDLVSNKGIEPSTSRR